MVFAMKIFARVARVARAARVSDLALSEGFVNERACGIAAIATLDRCRLLQKELLKFGVAFIEENRLEGVRKIASGKGSNNCSSEVQEHTSSGEVAAFSKF